LVTSLALIHKFPFCHVHHCFYTKRGRNKSWERTFISLKTIV
jgi:hypothetical protein